MRLIDADALKQKIARNVYPVRDYFNSKDYGMFWTGGIEKAIDEAHTVDAMPIRHGRWGDNYEGHAVCSECGGTTPWLYASDYCGHCGARMDEDDEEVK